MGKISSRAEGGPFNRFWFFSFVGGMGLRTTVTCVIHAVCISLVNAYVAVAT